MAMPLAATVAHDKHDPLILSSGPDAAPATQLARGGTVTIEEYMYWASITRHEESLLPKIQGPVTKLLGFTKSDAANHNDHSNAPTSEMKDLKAAPPSAVAVSDGEYYQAQRAARTAGWAAVFYLITTDVLGPYTVPWAMAQMGYGPGISLYAIFGALAGYTGWQVCFIMSGPFGVNLLTTSQLWRMFLQLDSDRYPMSNYSDIAYRIYGPFARHIVNVLQSVQLFCLVGVIIIGNGQGLYQINGNICYVVCCVIWSVLGMFLGQIRTLQRFGWIANFAVWINVIVMVLTMVVVTHSEPNYEAASK